MQQHVRPSRKMHWLDQYEYKPPMRIRTASIVYHQFHHLEQTFQLPTHPGKDIHPTQHLRPIINMAFSLIQS